MRIDISHSGVMNLIRFLARSSVLPAVLAAILLSALAAPRLLAKDDLAGLSSAEKYVLQELIEGKEADLSPFPRDQRVLSNEFVQKLLTDGFRDPEIRRRGVAINKAIFKETLEVSSMTVPYRVWLRSCDFDRGIDFSHTQFASDLSLEFSQFGVSSPSDPSEAKNSDTQAFFEGMRVANEADFSHSVSYVPVDFTGALSGLVK